MVFDEDFFVSEADGITISARPAYVGKNASQNLWGYYLCIENNSKEKVQLIGKNWNITDSRGNHFSDNSAGFKGEIPELEPGEMFEFSDIAPIEAEDAVFYGSCKVASKDNVLKEIKIPTFSMGIGMVEAVSPMN